MEKINTNTIQIIAATAVVEALQLLGITAGELTQAQAKAIYGSEFVRMVADGKIRPARVGRGVRGTRYYRVADILAARAAEYSKAKLI